MEFVTQSLTIVTASLAGQEMDVNCLTVQVNLTVMIEESVTQHWILQNV